MRIAIVAPLEVRVPPVAYGGTELVVSILTEELVNRGHDVTLFASGDSVTNAKLVSVTPEFLWREDCKSSPPLSLLNIVEALERADDFDLIHNHTTFEGFATAGLVETPVLTTLHGSLEGNLPMLFKHYKGWYNTISKSAKSLLPPKDRFAGVIYNAIDASSYTFNDGPRDDYLLFFSRMSPEKGPHIAIEVARKLNKKLVIAGTVHPGDRQYFEREVKPHIDNRQIIFEGEVSNRRKQELLSNATCLLAPICWPEPFGLFMVEALACGTPVIALNKGSAREVVSHGETGYVVNSVGEMVKAANNIQVIDPWNCRQRVLENFDVPIMVNKYLKAYREIVVAREVRAPIANAMEIPVVHNKLEKGKNSADSWKEQFV